MDLEKRGIIGCAFDTRHDTGFIVEFNAGRLHLVPDACTLDTGAEIIAKFTSIGGCQFTAKESGHIVCFNCLYCDADNGFIEWLKFG